MTDPRELAQRIVALRPTIGGTVGLAAEGDWEKEIAAILAAEMPRWVPVEEKLPKYGEIVLLWDKQFVETGMWREEDKWELERSNPQDETIYLDAEQVTHWQPLPSPPREEAP